MGNTLTGRFALSGSDTFTTLGSASGFTSTEFNIVCSGSQGSGGGARSTTALDVSFDNLIVEAEGFQGVVPGPPTLAIRRLDSLHLEISWPTNVLGFELESASILPASSWNVVTNHFVS